MATAFGALVMVDTLNTTALQGSTADGNTGPAFGILHMLAAGWMMAGALVPTSVAYVAGVQPAVAIVAGVIAALGARRS